MSVLGLGIYARLLDKHEIPFITKDDFSNVNWNDVSLINYKSSNKVNDKKNIGKNYIIDMFNCDSVLESIYKSPLNHLLRYKNALAVCTPDFTISPQMNINVLKNNVYKNRHIGCIWQTYGAKVIPTVQWADSSTFDIVFRGITKGSVVAVSTIGCMHKTKDFLKAYDEMMKCIEPKLVIVVGNLIDGIYGDIINYRYKDRFYRNIIWQEKNKSLFEIDKIQTIERGSDNYGGRGAF